MPIDAQTPEVLAPSEPASSLLGQLGGAAIIGGLGFAINHERAGLIVAGSGATAIAVGNLLRRIGR